MEGPPLKQKAPNSESRNVSKRATLVLPLEKRYGLADNVSDSCDVCSVLTLEVFGLLEFILVDWSLMNSMNPEKRLSWV